MRPLPLIVSVIALCLAACAQVNRPDPQDQTISVGHAVHAPKAAHGRLRIATYNVHMESAQEILRGIRADRELESADILFLQEIEATSEHTPQRLAELLGYDYAYAPGYGVGDGGSHGIAIVSRVSLHALKLIELPRHDVVFNSARRVALAATILLAEPPIRIYNVHLDNRLNPKDRAAQLRPVLADAQRLGATPALIGGDMNTSPFCWIGHVVPLPCGLQDDRIESSVRKSGFDTPVTKSGGTHKVFAMRLDAIYTRALSVTAFGVADDARISDHLPLWADIEHPRVGPRWPAWERRGSSRAPLAKRSSARRRGPR